MLCSKSGFQVLLVLGSLTSCDPSNIHETIQKMADANIKCSVIHLAAAVKVCETICKKTGGRSSRWNPFPSFPVLPSR